jgi:hypothetical protein
MKLFILSTLIFLTACGHANNKCRSQDEMILRCKAEAVSKWYPVPVPEYENKQCGYEYSTKACY